jgi:glycerol uptake facilitator-like aquaporin
MTTLREEVERELGLSPGKVGKRSPAWYIHQAPSAWRKTMKYWAVLILGFILGGITAGFVAVIVQIVA